MILLIFVILFVGVGGVVAVPFADPLSSVEAAP
jgi:uncharacterized protein involved in cysteine biosynthesis